MQPVLGDMAKILYHNALRHGLMSLDKEYINGAMFQTKYFKIMNSFNII